MLAQFPSYSRFVLTGLLALCLLGAAGCATAPAANGPETDPDQVVLRAARQTVDDKLCLTYSDNRPGDPIYMDPDGRHQVLLENRLEPFTTAQLEQFRPFVLRSGEIDAVKRFLTATSAVTNLHTHGLHVSPRGRSDNVLLKINPGRSNRYEFRLPPYHAPGTHWYHAHLHGSTALQVQGGMSGALIVREPEGQSLNPQGFPVKELDPMVIQVDCTRPPTAQNLQSAVTLEQFRSLSVDSLPESLRTLSQAESDDELQAQIDALEVDDQRALAKALGKLPAVPLRFVVNGQLNPVVPLAVGSYNRLRIVNSGSRVGDYKQFYVKTGEKFYLAAFDGVNLTHLPADDDGFIYYDAENKLELAPGNRADVYYLPSASGTHTLVMRGETRVRLTEKTEFMEPFTQELVTFEVSGPEQPPDAAQERAADVELFLAALNANLLRLRSSPPYRSYLRRFEREPTLQREIEFGVEGNAGSNRRIFRINGRDYNELENGRMRGHDDYLGKEARDCSRGRATPCPPITGTMESWAIRNTSARRHPFHIHVSPFWVHDITQNGRSLRQTDPNDPRLNRWQDVIDLPPGETVTVWQRFEDFPGLFVVHCHILQHEDRGMMINILLVPEGQDPDAFFTAEQRLNCEINNVINGTTCRCPRGCGH